MNEALVRLVWERARSRCEYCQLPQAMTRLPCQVDHVIAVKHHGPTRASNLALSCFACNNHKGPNIAGIDPTSGKIALFSIPAVTRGVISAGMDRFCGLTTIDRATVAVLEINLPYRVALRQALIEGGMFPLGINGLFTARKPRRQGLLVALRCTEQKFQGGGSRFGLGN